MISLKNKVVLITGASSGIGYELSKQLANEECNIALLARRDKILETLIESLKYENRKHLYVKCDVGNKEEVLSALTEIRNKFGEIDIAILNAGISYHSGVENFSSEKAEKIFNVNVFGIIYFIEQLLPVFMKNKSGIIVGISSLADGKGFPKSGFYCASKAAVSLLLESVRIELKKYNIKVITVKPGFIKTPMTEKNNFPMPFLIDASKAAEIIIQGIKKEKKIIQFPFGIVMGAKLLKILPDSIFKIIADKI